MSDRAAVVRAGADRAAAAQPSPAVETLPLLAGDPDSTFARRGGAIVTRRRYLQDVRALAERLPAHGAMLNLSADRYRFAVGFGAALVRGHASLQPSNHTVHTVERLQAVFARVYAVLEPGRSDADAHGLPVVRHADAADDAADATREVDVPRIAAEQVAAHVLTSGSTGEPVPHAKPWRLLVASATVEARRLGAAFGRASLEGATIVATVPPQHMYGFESSVLVAMHGGAALDAGRPFFAADVAGALAVAPAPRVLVTTPFHLRTLVGSAVAMPPVALVVCATAPLSPQLAADAERAFGAPLVEIYGCTEAGQVATRRTVEGPEWRVFDGLVLCGDGDAVVVDGGSVPQPTRLADVLEVEGGGRFRLLGRSNDLVNIAGKRSSFGHLNFHLNAVDGVDDGAYWLPPDDGSGATPRLVAFVVAPRQPAARIVEALRQRVDAAFLPRRVVHVEALPRAATGKLTAESLAALARERLA